MLRSVLTLAAASAALPLGACDSTDPLGLHPEPELEVVAPLELTGRLVDAADLLSEAQERELTAQLAAIEEETLAQLVVVTTPSLNERPINDYSLALGRGWGMGDAERNDGLLLVVAPNERKVRIEVGYGLEETVEDPEAAEIIQRVIPLFEEGDTLGAIGLAVDLLEAELREPLMKEAA